MLLDASHCIYIYIKAPCCSLSRTAEQHFKFSARLLFSLSRPGLQPTSALYSFLYYLFRLAELTAAAPPTFRYCTGGTYEISDRLNLSVIYNSTFIYLYVYIPVAYILYIHICFFVAFAFVYWQPWHSADSCESSYIKEETNPNSISNHIYTYEPLLPISYLCPFCRFAPKILARQAQGRSSLFICLRHKGIKDGAIESYVTTCDICNDSWTSYL